MCLALTLPLPHHPSLAGVDDAVWVLERRPRTAPQPGAGETALKVALITSHATAHLIVTVRFHSWIYIVTSTVLRRLLKFLGLHFQVALVAFHAIMQIFKLCLIFACRCGLIA